MSEVIEDRSVEFLLLRTAGAGAPDVGALLGRAFPRVHWRDAFAGVRDALWGEVWGLKTALDGLAPDAYLAVRNRLFPLAVGGAPGAGGAFFNRAGHKLLETLEAAGVWRHLQGRLRPPGEGGGGGGGRGGGRKRPRAEDRPRRRPRPPGRPLVFADVCGGPGAFAQALLAAARGRGIGRVRGFGMTLAGVEGLGWYPALLRAAFTPTFGLDGTGDVYRLANLHALASLSTETLLCVADGGFHLDAGVANFQEAVSSRILFAQWLAALKILRPGGCLVLKLFDTTLPFTRGVLFLSTFLYERVHVVKPKHSRVVNSERYLVCVDYQGIADRPGWMAYFDDVLERGFTDNDYIPELFPETWMTSDSSFMQSLQEMVRVIARNQKIGLKMILDKASKEKAQAEEGKSPSDDENAKDEEMAKDDEMAEDA